MKNFRRLPAFCLTFCLILASAILPAQALDYSADLTVNADSVLLMDADNDEVLFAQDPDARHFPASITKVMTGLLAVEAVEAGKLTMDQQVTLGGDLYTGIGEGGSTQNLKTGETLTVRDLLNCALIPSANEACNALADLVSGTIPDFVDRMNEYAAELGMTGTHFVNPHGYHDDNHYTTARDIYLLCREAIKHPDFRTVVSSTTYVVPPTNMTPTQRTLHDTNALISTNKTNAYLYEYAIGIKTGSTPEAGHCLASAAVKDGRTLICVVLGAQDFKEDAQDNYFQLSRDLLEMGFNDFSRQTILSGIDPVATLPVALCPDLYDITVQPVKELTATLPKDFDMAQFQRTVELPASLEAPLKQGQVVGKLTLTLNGETYGAVDLAVTADLERSQLLYVLDRTGKFFDQLWVKLVLIVLGLGIVILVVRHLLFGSKKDRYGRKKGYRGR